jgi:hypothetical protein
VHRSTVLRLLTYLLAAGLLMAALSALQAQPARANELRVCPTCTYRDISSANAFAHPGDTILVEPGVYTEPYRIYFAHGVTISSTEGADKTILRPGTQNMLFDITGRGAADTPPRTLKGFTLVGHPAQGGIERGGGIYIANGARPLIVNNIFSDCLATQRGGAVCIEEEGTQPTIRGNRFERNAVRGSGAKGGGAISVSDAIPIITGNLFIDNYSSNHGGAIYIFWKDGWVAPQRGIITGNTFIGNAAYNSGGAVYAIDAKPLILGNNILSNTASSGAGIYGNALAGAVLQGNLVAHNAVVGTNDLLSVGGGLAVANSKAVTVDGNTIQDNRAWKGAGIYIEIASSRAVTVTNNVLTGNGSCELMVRSASPLVANNTILDYTGAGSSVGIDVLGASSKPELANNIVAKAGIGIRSSLSAAPSLRNNDVWNNPIANYNGLNPGMHDLSVDPELRGPDDCHLQAQSPLVDAGSNDHAPPQDFEGDPRPFDGNGDGNPVADVGADEYSVAASPTPTGTATQSPTPSPTSEPPTPTQTLAPSPSATPWATETPAATATSTAPVPPTATGTPRPTFTATAEHSLTPTRTATGTPTGVQRCMLLVAVWQDEFDDPGLSQWWSDWAAGFGGVAGSVLSIGAEGAQDRFPLLWSQPPIPVGDWVLELRLRYGAGAGNETGIGVGSAAYDGTRYASGAPAPEGIEDVLSIRGSAAGLRVSLLDQLSASEPPGDVAWHVVRITRQATAIGLNLDGREVRTIADADRTARSIFIGSPVIMHVPAMWTPMQLDYVRLSRCAAWERHLCWLPVIRRGG